MKRADPNNYHDCIDIDNNPTGKDCEACRREAETRYRICANCHKVTKHRPATECWNCKQSLP